jgi:hypothetical protein
MAFSGAAMPQNLKERAHFSHHIATLSGSETVVGYPMKRAVLYLRVSTLDQTTANQERELRDVAGRMGCDVITASAVPRAPRLRRALPRRHEAAVRYGHGLVGG